MKRFGGNLWAGAAERPSYRTQPAFTTGPV
jgi:hypothetical protein